MYDVALNYSPVKYLASTTQGKRNCMAIGPDSAVLATVAHTGQQDEVRGLAGRHVTELMTCRSPCRQVRVQWCSQLES